MSLSVDSRLNIGDPFARCPLLPWYKQKVPPPPKKKSMTSPAWITGVRAMARRRVALRNGGSVPEPPNGVAKTGAATIIYPSIAE